MSPLTNSSQVLEPCQRSVVIALDLGLAFVTRCFLAYFVATCPSGKQRVRSIT